MEQESKYTPLYEKGIKETKNKSMETTLLQPPLYKKPSLAILGA